MEPCFFAEASQQHYHRSALKKYFVAWSHWTRSFQCTTLWDTVLLLLLPHTGFDIPWGPTTLNSIKCKWTLMSVSDHHTVIVYWWLQPSSIVVHTFSSPLKRKQTFAVAACEQGLLFNSTPLSSNQSVCWRYGGGMARISHWLGTPFRSRQHRSERGTAFSSVATPQRRLWITSSVGSFCATFTQKCEEEEEEEHEQEEEEEGGGFGLRTE